MVPDRHLRAASAAVLVVLAACATRPPGVADMAGVAVPTQWAQPRPAGGATFASWWSSFGDPMLAELVAAAARGNTDVARAGANLRLARALRQQAAAGLLPTISAGASGQRSDSAAGGRTTLQAGLDAAWEPDLFGANRHALGSQEAQVRASAATLAATHVSVAAEVALAYLDVRAAQVRTAVARENLASQEETLQISRWRQQAGLANSLEVEQALGAVEQTRAQVPGLLAAAAAAAHALAVLVGEPPEALLQRLAATPAVLPQPSAALEVAIPAQALRQRPDVFAAEQQLRAAASDVAAADAQRKPAVNLSASLAWTGATLGSIGSVAAARSLLASIAQPLFDAGRRDAQLAAREAAFDAAGAGYRATVLVALQEVEDALASLAADRERLAALQRALAAARNASLLATQRHASGLIDFQTVLETQRTLLSVQDSVASVQAAVAADHVRLYKALGGGWRDTGMEMNS
ncbi:efflux transporter outer membrane subunit [Ramlibacter sp. AN1133]|uniref:efflux transporter outer membrane subunit n=1 Tax=Ramlibacter sp. AN1133 TaxID=3133429 RepID=UPI0030BA4777